LAPILKWQRRFPMASLKFVTSLLRRILCHISNFQVNYNFIDSFTIGIESQSSVHYLVDVNVYVWFWALKLRCTQYGFCGQHGIQERKGNSFTEVGRGRLCLPIRFRIVFSQVAQKLRITGSTPSPTSKPRARKSSMEVL
jgi:hypothetical protein